MHLRNLWVETYPINMLGIGAYVHRNDKRLEDANSNSENFSQLKVARG